MEEKGVYLHYLYNTWICFQCYFHSEDGEIETAFVSDWDGVWHHKMCDLCSEEKDDNSSDHRLLPCSTCHRASCTRCLTHNLGNPKVLKFAREGNYRCFGCDPDTLTTLVEEAGWTLPEVMFMPDMLSDRPWRTVKRVDYKPLHPLIVRPVEQTSKAEETEQTISAIIITPNVVNVAEEELIKEDDAPRRSARLKRNKAPRRSARLTNGKGQK